MYTCLKDWMDLPCVINHATGRTGTGDILYAAPLPTSCYLEGKCTIIKDFKGKEVTSMAIVYLDGSETVGPNDTVVIEGKTRTVLNYNTFYRNGVADILEVYV